MTYIYDILLNFNEEYYDFFDWNKNDKILHIKKIPIYKISDKELIEILNNKIIFDKSFLEYICDKTEVFLKHEIKKLKYCCLLCTDEKVIGCNIDTNGRMIGVSDLLIDEYGEISETLKDCKNIDIRYKIEKNNKISLFKTRYDKNREKFIETSIKKFNNEELQYIYYEMYSDNESNKDKILNRLITTKDKENLYNLVKCITGMYKKIK